MNNRDYFSSLHFLSSLCSAGNVAYQQKIWKDTNDFWLCMWKGRNMGKSIIGHLVYSHAKGTFPRKGLLRKMSPNVVKCIGLTFISWKAHISRALVVILQQLLHSTHHWFCSSWTTFECNGSWEPHELANCPQPAFCQPWTFKVSTSFLFSHEHSRNGLLLSIYIYRAYVRFLLQHHTIFCMSRNFLSLKVLLKRQLSRWAALVELSHTPPLLSHWALPRQKFPTWEMMIYISISLPASLHHPIHFATAGHRCASLRKTLSNF